MSKSRPPIKPDSLALLHQQIADQFQVALPRLSRVRTMLRQNLEDTARALEALENAVGALRTHARDQRAKAFLDGDGGVR